MPSGMTVSMICPREFPRRRGPPSPVSAQQASNPGCPAVISRQAEKPHPELRVASGIYIDMCGVVDQSLIVPGKSAPTYICTEYLPTYTALVSAMCCAYPCSTGKASWSSVHVADVPVPLIRLMVRLQTNTGRYAMCYCYVCKAGSSWEGSCPQRRRPTNQNCLSAKRPYLSARSTE